MSPSRHLISDTMYLLIELCLLLSVSHPATQSLCLVHLTSCLSIYFYPLDPPYLALSHLLLPPPLLSDTHTHAPGSSSLLYISQSSISPAVFSCCCYFLSFIPLSSVSAFLPSGSHRIGCIGSTFCRSGCHGQLVFFAAGQSICRAVDLKKKKRHAYQSATFCRHLFFNGSEAICHLQPLEYIFKCLFPLFLFQCFFCVYFFFAPPTSCGDIVHCTACIHADSGTLYAGATSQLNKLF